MTEPTLQEKRKGLKNFRRRSGLALEELASLSGLSRSMLSKFELGHRDLSEEAFARLRRAIVNLAGMAGGNRAIERAIKEHDLKDYSAKFRNAMGNLLADAKELQRQRRYVLGLLEKLSKAEPQNEALQQVLHAERAALAAHHRLQDLHDEMQKLDKQSLIRRIVLEECRLWLEKLDARIASAGE